MLSDNQTPHCYFGNDIESTIPINRYDKLCNYVICWKHFGTSECSECNKKYCSEHESNHICIKEELTITHSVLPLTKQEFEPIEVITA